MELVFCQFLCTQGVECLALVKHYTVYMVSSGSGIEIISSTLHTHAHMQVVSLQHRIVGVVLIYGKTIDALGEATCIFCLGFLPVHMFSQEVYVIHFAVVWAQ